MNAVKFKKLITDLKNSAEQGDEWLNRVPREINSAFFDNPYVDSLDRTKTLLLNALFEDTSLLQEVEWFLYEWSPEKDESYRTITYQNEFKYVINNVDDFVEFLSIDGLLTV